MSTRAHTHTHTHTSPKFHIHPHRPQIAPILHSLSHTHTSFTCTAHSPHTHNPHSRSQPSHSRSQPSHSLSPPTHSALTLTHSSLLYQFPVPLLLCCREASNCPLFSNSDTECGGPCSSLPQALSSVCGRGRPQGYRHRGGPAAGRGGEREREGGGGWESEWERRWCHVMGRWQCGVVSNALVLNSMSNEDK